MRITEAAVRKYFRELLETPRIQEYAKQYGTISNFINIQGDVVVRPKLSVVKTVGAGYAGMAWGSVKIEISRWILEDKLETRGAVRHELAHLLHVYSRTGGGAHGKEFRNALKIVSPKTWRKDRHWYPNPAIENARTQIHPGPKKATIWRGKKPYTVKQKQLVNALEEKKAAVLANRQNSV